MNYSPMGVGARCIFKVVMLGALLMSIEKSNAQECKPIELPGVLGGPSITLTCKPQVPSGGCTAMGMVDMDTLPKLSPDLKADVFCPADMVMHSGLGLSCMPGHAVPSAVARKLCWLGERQVKEHLKALSEVERSNARLKALETSLSELKVKVETSIK